LIALVILSVVKNRSQNVNDFSTLELLKEVLKKLPIVFNSTEALTMKLTLKMTMAAALVAVSSSAFAVLPNNTGIAGEGFAAGVTPDVTLTISGATAPDKGIRGLLNSICLAGTATQFTDSCVAGSYADNCAGGAAKFPGSSYGAIMCQMDNSAASVPGLTAGTKNVLLRKRSAGGSFWGTSPVAFAATDNSQMKLSDTNCKLTSVANQYICNKSVTYTGSQAVADMGFSDLPPREFVAPNVATGEAECKTDCLSKLNTDSTAALGFGVPVTNALYVRLQKAQGLNSDVDGNLVDDATQKSLFHNNANGFQAQFEANMPSLSKSQVASLMTGKVDRWSKVFYNNVNNANLPTALSDVAFGPALTDNRVFVCRRVDGSGTQSTTNINLLNVPCSADAESPKPDNSICLGTTGVPAASPAACSTATYANPVQPTAGSNNPVIHENSGSGDVDNCLTSVGGAGKLGIGIQSLEKNTAAYSHIKIDGVAPTLANMATGKYFNWGGVSGQWRNADVNENNDPAQPVVAAPAGDKLVIMQTVRNDSASPTELNALNNSAPQPFGKAGYLSLTNATIKPFNAALPVMQWTNGGKSCNPMKPRAATGTGVGVDFGL
jgi:hypothetical protein